MPEHDEEIKARRVEWRAAVNAGDLDMYTDLVTPDLVWLPPSGSVVHGRDAFRAWLRPFMDQYSYAFSIEPSEVRLFEGYCAEVGSFKSVMTKKTGDGEFEHAGTYLVIWRVDEADGKWRIERYVDGIGSSQRKNDA